MSGTLEVVAVTGPALVEDGGRKGHLHEGVPPGGALVPELLALANAAVGNRAGEAGLEIYGGLRLRAVGAPVTVATDEEDEPRRLAPGEDLVVDPPRQRRLRTLAVGGGVAVPEALGGRGTLLVAGLGGLDGRLLRRGDHLPVGDAATGGAPCHPEAAAAVRRALVDPAPPIRLLPGPDAERFEASALDTLLGASWVLSPTSDRSGLRLDGPALVRRDRDAAVSAPMVWGAIQVPSGGQPIVLGPDHPTTGGYPILAVVIGADRGRLAVRRPGSAVRFAAVSLIEARRAWREHQASLADVGSG